MVSDPSEASRFIMRANWKACIGRQLSMTPAAIRKRQERERKRKTEEEAQKRSATKEDTSDEDESSKASQGPSTPKGFQTHRRVPQPYPGRRLSTTPSATYKRQYREKKKMERAQQPSNESDNESVALSESLQAPRG